MTLVTTMFLKSCLSIGLLLSSTALAHPVGLKERGFPQNVAQLTVYEDTVAKPTLLKNQVLIFIGQDGEFDATSTEDVLVLPVQTQPPKHNKEAPSSRATTHSTTTLTKTTTRTTTLTLEHKHTAAPMAPAKPNPGLFGPGGVPIPSELPLSAAGPAPHSSSKPQSGKPSGSHTLSSPKSKGHVSTQHSSSSPALNQSGISYSPYRADSTCKTQDEINDDFARFSANYGFIRMYGTDCDQTNTIYKAAKNHGKKIFMGIYDINKVPDEVNTIISSVGHDWNQVHTISVGNELVNSGQATPAQVIAAMNQARTLLRAAGYQGPVVNVDTFIAAENHPELCDESDYCAVNAHAFFDPTITAGQAGKWLQNTIQRVQKAMTTSKPIMITETGWPTQGMPNGLAVPSLASQNQAIASIKSAFADKPGQIVLFSAFNDLWKAKSLATFDADQYWGIGGAVSQADSA